MAQHRFSGWPGAWCLDCGAEDVREICVAEHNHGIDSEGMPIISCVNTPCPTPGSNAHNPYVDRDGQPNHEPENSTVSSEDCNTDDYDYSAIENDDYEPWDN